MGSSCNGICTRYKVSKPIKGGRYANGQKRCQICAIFIKTDDLRCPCCGYQLRTKARGSKYKKDLEMENKS